MPACLSPGHLHAHHFFTQTAAPSLERKLAVAVDPQSQRAGAWDFPHGGIWESGEPKISKSCTALFVKSVTWTKYQLKIDYMPCQSLSYQGEKLSVVKETSVAFYFYLMVRVHFWINLYYLLYLHCHPSSQAQGSWQNVGTNVADKLRTSSSWQERLEHLSEELMRS